MLLGKPTHFEWAQFMRVKGMSIGEGTTLNPGANCMDHERVIIGKNCSISSCSFNTHSGGDRILNNKYKTNICSDDMIIVEDNVIICEGVSIRYGVRIGEGAMIGPKCSIDEDVPPGVILKAPKPRMCGYVEDYVKRRVGNGIPT